MAAEYKARGQSELKQIRKQSRTLYWFVALFSIFANLLMFTGPLYMLQAYDRVLGSRSEATLVALSLIVVFLYAMMGILDFRPVWISASLTPSCENRPLNQMKERILA